MSFPRSFLPLVKSPRFWTDYFFLTDTPYDSPYKQAFRDIEDESDDESNESRSENQDSEDPQDSYESDQDVDDQGSDDQDAGDSGPDDENASDEGTDPSDPANDDNDDVASDQPPTLDNAAENDETKSTSSSSSSSRPSSPYYSHNLTFSFNQYRIRSDTDFNLSISLSPSLSYFALTFTADPLAYDVDIAHDDQAHWHPWVLRWDELELICRAVGITRGGQKGEWDTEAKELYRHPGLPLLFLYRFAPICQGDDAERIVGMLAKAWGRVLGEDAKDVRRLIERMDCRKRGFRWFKEGENWWIGKGDDAETAEGVYTYRSKESVKSGKWFNEAWNAFIKEAERTVGDVKVSDEEEEEYRVLGRKFAPRERHGLEIWLALREKDRPMHQRAGRYLYLTLDGVLRILEMGRATSSGASSCIINGRSVWTSDHMAVTIYGDLTRGRAFVKQMLWWLRAPLATTLRDASKYGELPFSLADETEDRTDEVYIGITVPDILPDCSWLVGHTLPDSLGATLQSKEVLGDSGQVSGPTNDGWFTLTTVDGGEFGFNFTRFDGEELEGTGAIALRHVTTQASATLLRLMAESGAVLPPLGLAAKPLTDKVAELSWVTHRIVDAETLHAILSAGPFDSWVKAERTLDDDYDSSLDDSGDE